MTLALLSVPVRRESVETAASEILSAFSYLAPVPPSGHEYDFEPL
jgi:hypothetical protein